MKLTFAVICFGLAVTFAQAQPATTLTLACKGTVSAQIYEKPQAISMGIIVNFATRTVQGFERFLTTPGFPDMPVMITAVNDTTITFRGRQQVLTSAAGMDGSIDRVTGDVEATYILTNPKTNNIVGQFDYALQCRPTQRMF